MVKTKAPRRDELWLGRPPYTIVAHVLSVERVGGQEVVSYELCDEGGSVLEQVEHARLDEGWWRAFQPMTPRYG